MAARALEAMLAEHPDDVATWQVYADALIERGEPWGAMIAEACAGRPDLARQAEVERALLGDCTEATVRWDFGAIRELEFGMSAFRADGRNPMAEAFARIVAHPAGRMLRRAVFSLPALPDIGPDDLASYFERVAAIRDAFSIYCSHDPILDVLARCQPLPLLESLDFCRAKLEHWRRVGDLGPLRRAAPRLRQLYLSCGAAVDGGPQLGTLDSPSLRTLTIFSTGIDVAMAHELSAAMLPALERCSVHVGWEHLGPTCQPRDLARFFDGHGMPAVMRLSLGGLPRDPAWVEAVVRSAMLPRLVALDLSNGRIGEAGARVLIEHARKLAHLEVIDLDGNYVPEELRVELRRRVPNVHVGVQYEGD
ncbi:MAG: hypothetical protein ACTHU0_37435 [Kofleriaceae bacterium]